jgi:hypothetical protein
MELDVLAFGERLIASIPALRLEADKIVPEADAARALVRATVARAWRKRGAHANLEMRSWLGELLRREYANGVAGERRSFSAD